MDYTDILNNCTEETISGLKCFLYYAAKCDIAAWPSLPAAPTSDTELVTIPGDFTMKTGKYFHKIEIKPLSAEVKNTLQGAIGSKNFGGKLPFVIVGSSVAKEAFARKMKNFEGVLIPEEAMGVKRMFGNEGFPATVESMEGTTGLDPAKDGYEDTYTLIAPVNVGKVPRYTGNIPLDPSASSSSS